MDFSFFCETAESRPEARPNHVMYTHIQEENKLQDQLLIVRSRPDSRKKKEHRASDGFYTTANLVSDTPTQRTSCQTAPAVGQRYQSARIDHIPARDLTRHQSNSDNFTTEVIKLSAL